MMITAIHLSAPLSAPAGIVPVSDKRFRNVQCETSDYKEPGGTVNPEQCEM